MRQHFVTYYSVDIETNGPVPGLYDMVSLGATTVHNRDGRAILGETFYMELRPQAPRFDQTAAAIHGLDQNRLHLEGLPRAEACRQFTAWIAKTCDPKCAPVFVGHNAPFDWPFVNYMYAAENIENPFGFKALDTKALAMGVLDIHWFKTSKEALQTRLNLPIEDNTTKHRADADAKYQARILASLLNRMVTEP